MTIAVKSKIPIKRDLTFKRNSRWTQTISLKQNDGVTPLDTTGYTMSMVIKSSVNGETYITLSIGSGITHTPSAGQFVLLLTAAQILAFDFAAAVFDIIVTPTGSEPVVPEYGNITVIG